MSRAWRVVAALTVSLGVAYVVTSWLAGRVVERVYRDQLDQVIGLLVEQSSVVERHYRRGIFRSEGSIVLKMPLVPGEQALKSWFRAMKISAGDRDATGPKDACAGIRCLSVHLDQKVEHGPLVDGRPLAARVRLTVTRLEGAPGPSRHLAEKLQSRQLIVSHGWTGRFSTPARCVSPQAGSGSVRPALPASLPDTRGPAAASRRSRRRWCRASGRQ